MDFIFPNRSRVTYYYGPDDCAGHKTKKLADSANVSSFPSALISNSDKTNAGNPIAPIPPIKSRELSVKVSLFKNFVWISQNMNQQKILVSQVNKTLIMLHTLSKVF